MDDKLVTVAKFSFQHRAFLIKGWLDSAGIESCVVEQGYQSSLQNNLPGGFEVLVNKDDLAKAKPLVDSVIEKYGPEKEEAAVNRFRVRKILVPIDFSKFSMNACRYALRLADQKGAEVMLVHAYFNPIINPLCYDNTYTFPSNVNDALEEIELRAEEGMSNFVGQIQSYIESNDLGHLQVNRQLVGGIAEDAILNIVKKDGYDMIVLGTKGRADADYWYGSVTSKIISKAKVPVLAIPKDSLYKDISFKRVMYLTDFDTSDLQALQKLLQIVKPLQVDVHVVHLSKKIEDPFKNYDMSAFETKVLELSKTDNIRFSHIEEGKLPDGIDGLVDESEIDILALTSHKRNILTKYFNPSLTKKLMKQSRIPLLVFHSKS